MLTLRASRILTLYQASDVTHTTYWTQLFDQMHFNLKNMTGMA